MIFYLGTHRPDWLGRAGVPLFVSYARLKERRGLPRAAAPWSLDSSGFTQLSTHGRWTFSATTYAQAARRYQDQIGSLDFASAMDWMCEPAVLAKTGKTVAYHQERTVANYLDLRERAPEVPWLPVLQGWSRDDYRRCLDKYVSAGVTGPRFGLGSVCRRQATDEAEWLIRELSWMGLRLHAFGFKVRGLRRISGLVASADSLAWNYEAHRWRDRVRGGTCCGKYAHCANCLDYALAWRARLVGA